MEFRKRLETSLLALRLGVFLVMLMWTMDKFVNTDHAMKIWQSFYFSPELGNVVMFAIGSIQMILILMFVTGVAKRFSYGAVLFLHSVSTFSSYQQYLSPYSGPNLLFFAAWPMLAACLALYLLREEDKMLILGK